MSLRDILAGIEPESIPFPLSRVYSLLTKSSLFLDFYQVAASQVLERHHSGRVLDIGTGPGKLPIMIASRGPMLQVTGLDTSPDMVRMAARSAAEKGLKNVEFQQGNAAELSFHDGEFDLVISTLSFHHWKEPEKALDEIYRVLRDGGEAWIYDISRDIDQAAFARAKSRYGFISSWLFRLHSFTEPFYTQKEIDQLASESRFRKHTITPAGMAYRLQLFK